MKRNGNTYKTLICLLLVAALGCSRGQVKVRTEQPQTTGDRFETLLPQDTLNVPAMYPVEGIVGTPMKPIGGADTVSNVPTNTTQPVVGHRFRIQLITSNQFSEANFSKKVAEEIFDTEIEVAYEAPYYKLRIGSFLTREEAEAFLPQVRTAGYPDAIVVSTLAELRKAEPAYDTTQISAPPDSGSGQ